jgi:hypothetical protein
LLISIYLYLYLFFKEILNKYKLALRQIEQLFIEETLINELNETDTTSSSHHQQEHLNLARSVDLYKKWKSLAGGEHHSLSFTSLQGYLTEAENFFLNTSSSSSGSTNDGGGGRSIKREDTSNARRSASPKPNEKRYTKRHFSNFIYDIIIPVLLNVSISAGKLNFFKMLFYRVSWVLKGKIHFWTYFFLEKSWSKMFFAL